MGARVIEVRDKGTAMEKNNGTLQGHNLLYRLSCLPEKIISAYDRENLIEFVLYELCDPECLNFNRAAFLIDNPDFNCLKGITGICTQEHSYGEDIWKQPEAFSHRMQQAAFNTAVRAIRQTSVQKHTQDSVTQLAQHLCIENPGFHTFNVKHGNTGILIYNQPQDTQSSQQEHVPAGASLLAFCPLW